MGEDVKCWKEPVTIPTYELGEDEKNPVLEFEIAGPRYHTPNRPVYPYPMQFLLTQNRVDKTYNGVFLENKYVKLLVLPDLGGRLQGAIDKSNGWDFLYWNHVIKPARIATRGAYLSGGIEWNHPGGHSCTQLEKISYVTLDNPDGSKSIVVAEIEPVRSHKWVATVTLYPDRSYVETRIKLINLCPTPAPFYCSINAAAHATDETEFIYPRGAYVTGHGGAEVSEFPAINGIDYSRLKNVLHSLSFFSLGLRKGMGYYGCYSHDRKSGTVAAADYAKVPGQKYFTWGKWDDGRLWDKILTDEDGAYLELQSGAFWHNIGYGYAWLDPHELKEAKIYWYPIKEIGAFKKANEEAAVNLEVFEKGKAMIGVAATSVQPGAKVTLKEKENILFVTTIDLVPDKPFTKEVSLPLRTDVENLVLTVYSAEGTELISYSNRPVEASKPTVVPPPRSVEDMTTDQLYIRAISHAGGSPRSNLPDLFLMQPRGVAVENAFKEILKRDPQDSRANRALGLICYERGLYDEAEHYLKKALERDDLVGSYEAHYYLGLVNLARGNLDGAEEEFGKASNRYAYHSSSCYYLAEIAMRRGLLETALKLVEESLTTNTKNVRANELKIVVLRKLKRMGEAEEQIEATKALDPTDFVAWSETYLIHGKEESKAEKKADLNNLLDRRARSFIGTHLYIELAINYLDWGLLDDGLRMLLMASERAIGKSKEVYPLVEYYLGYFFGKKGDMEKADKHLKLGAKANPDYCFPHRREDIEVLKYAVARNPNDARAHYYLGNVLWYLDQRKEAIKNWEESAGLEDRFSIVHRNLGNAYITVNKDLKKAISSLEKAFALNPDDPRILYELTELYEWTDKTEKAAQLVTRHVDTVEKLDDLVLRRSIAYLRLRKYEDSLKVLENYCFTRREVGQGSHTIFADILLRQAKEHLEVGRHSEALEKIKKALTYPENLQQAEHYCRDFCRENYLLGCAYEGLGERGKAREHWEKSVIDDASVGTASEYYRALSLRKLGREDEARSVFENLLSHAENQLKKKEYVAGEVGTAAESQKRLYARNLYLQGLAYEGLGRAEESKRELDKAMKLDPDVEINAYVAALGSIPRLGYRRPWDRLTKETTKPRKE